MAATMTVLLSVAAASIAYSIARQTVMSTRSTSTRVDAASAKAAAEEVLASVEAQLQANPTGFLTKVFPQERARKCLSGPAINTVFQPNTAFPKTCGSFWTYTAPTVKGLASVEISAPTPSDPRIHVKVLSRQPSLDDGIDALFALDGGRRWVWASTSGMALDSISPSSKVTIGGGAYSTGGITGPQASGVLFSSGAALATGATSLPSLTLSGVSLYSSTADLLATTPVLDVDNIQRSTLSPGSLATAASFLEDVACPGAPAENFMDAAFQSTTAYGLSSHLCLRSGETLALSSWTATQNDRVVVPSNIQAYMVLLDTPAQNQMTVYATNRQIDLSATSSLACTPRPSCTTALMNAGNHPGQSRFWTDTTGQLLGVFRMPVSGVVFADADLYLGVCSSNRNEYALGEVCSVRSGTEPGMSVSSPLTVVAGSLRAPKNVVINSTIHPRQKGQLGVVATRQVVLPYWMSAAGSQAVVGAHLLAAGVGTTGASVVPFPSSPLTADRFGSLVFNGSITGNGLGLGNSLATAVTYKTAADSSGVPPWFGGSDATWRRRETLRFAGIDACNARKCDSWTADKTADITPGDPEPPASSTRPNQPTGVLATPSWGGTAQAVVSFSSPLVTGTSPLDAYRATCISSNGGARRTATGSSAPVTVTSLDFRRMYSCFVEAHSAAGYSDPSTSSSSFEAWGPADAPTSVTVVAAWNTVNRKNQATVSFATPVSNGGMAITKYTVTCSSSDGGVTQTLDGFSPLVLSGLTKQKTYTCSVTATNPAGASASSAASASFIPIGPPDAPTFGANAPIVNGVTIVWTPGATGGSAITGYKLRWSTDGGVTWASSYSLSMTSPQNITGLTPGTSYVFSINATNAIDTSDWSSASTPVKVYREPDAPTLSSVIGGNALLTATFVTPGYDGGTAITSYQYSLDNGAWVTFPAMTLTQNITGLTAGQTYSVRIRAANAAGGGAASNAISATAYTVPGAPTISSISGVDKTLTVNFTAPGTNGGSAITAYQYSLDSGAWVGFSGLTSPQTISSLSIQSYSVRIRAVNVVGGGAASAAMTGNANGPPPAPAGLSVDTQTPTSMNLVWTYTNPGDLSKFQVYNSAGTLLADNIATTTRSWSRTGLSQNSTYTYYIRAVDAAGNTTNSASFDGSTTNATPAAPAVSWQNGGKVGTGSGTYQHRLCWSGDNEVMIYQVRIDGVNWQDIWRPAGGWAATVCSSYGSHAAGTAHSWYATSWDDYWAGANSTTKYVTEGNWGDKQEGWAEYYRSGTAHDQWNQIKTCSNSQYLYRDPNYYAPRKATWTATIARAGSPYYDLTSTSRRMDRRSGPNGFAEWAPRGTGAASTSTNYTTGYADAGNSGYYGSRASTATYTCYWNSTYMIDVVIQLELWERVWSVTRNAWDTAPVYS